ncbi:MAG: oligosaccharide flippase family protein [Christensenellales bacterium]
MKNKIATNYIYNLVYQALNIIVPIVTIPYVTRIVMPADMGIFSTAQTLFSILTLAAQFGVLVYGTRAIAMVSDDPAQMLSRLRSIYSTQVATTLVLLIPSFLIPLFITNASITGWIYAINAFLIFNATFDISWFYNGQEEFRITITRNIFVKLIAVALIFLFVKKTEDIVLYAVIYVFAALLGNVSMFIGLKKFAGTYRIFSLRWMNWKVVKEAVPYLIPLLITSVYLETGRFFLYGISGEAVTGIYDQAIKVARLFIIITMALVAVVGPRMSKFVGAKSFDQLRGYFFKIFIFLMFQSILVMVGILVVGNDFVAFFFGPEYYSVTTVLKVLSIYPLVYSVESSMLALLVRPLGLTKTMLTASIVSLAANILLNSLLVPLFGAIGASIALIVSSLVYSTVQVIGCYKYILWKKIIKNVSSIIISGIITTILLLLLKSRFYFESYANFLIYGVACIVIFIGLVITLCKDIRIFAVRYMKNVLTRLHY